MSKKNSFKKHDNCEVEIRWKVVRNQLLPVPALFCKEHNSWIKWLSREEAFYLIDSLNVPVAVYTQIKKKQYEKR